MVDFVTTNAQDSTVGAAICKAVASKHLPALLGEGAAAQPLATACAAQHWLAPLLQRAGEAEDTEAVQGDSVLAVLLKAPHADSIAVAIAAEADRSDTLLGATMLLRLLRIKALPPAAVAALAPLVADAAEGALETLRALLPPEAVPLDLAKGALVSPVQAS